MTDESRGPDKASESRQRWAKDLQDALDRTSEAVRTAWEASRDSRTSALESARRTVRELGEMLEQGVGAAKERWQAESSADEPEESRTETPYKPSPPPGSEPPPPPGGTPPGEAPPPPESPSTS